MLTDQKVLDIIKQGGRLYNKTIQNNIELKAYLDNRYLDIPQDMFSYKEVLYRIERCIDIRPVCRVCGNPVSFIGDVIGKSINGYRMTCSHQCHGLDRISIEKAKEAKNNRSRELKQQEKEKREQTCICRYGERNVFIVKKQQIKETMKERYGGYTLESAELKNKVKDTNIERYGVENVFASDIIKDRIISNNVKKYGVDHYSKTDKGRKKLSECATKSLYKRCKTCKKRYGVDYALANSDIAQKRIETLRKNQTFNTSKVEQLFKEYLITKFQNDVECQYKSIQYPYNCDFYIKPLDLYIELQGSWTHGGHPFNENDINDINRLNTLKLKNSLYYQNAAKTWAIRDVNKRNIAKQNKLNYLEIFSNNINEVINIFEEFINNRKS